MKKLVVFGDSFANLPYDDPQWADMLATKMNIPCLNLGAAGSSLGYGFHQFCMYSVSREYDAEDVIVFILTGSKRIYTQDMPTPALGVLQRTSPVPSEKEWIAENLEPALWAVEKIYNTEINYELIKTICYLKTWAASRKNMVVVIPAFDDVSYINKQELNDIKPTANFIPLQMPGYPELPTLYTISEREYGTDWQSAKDQNFKSVMSGRDRRTNHLSQCNLVILADMLFDVITYADRSKYDIARFEKHFLKAP